MGDGLKRANAAAKASRTKSPLQRDIEAFVRDVCAVKSHPIKSKVVAGLRSLMEQSHSVGYVAAAKAYGGCTSCYGKGYSTEQARETLVIRPCACPRGKQLDEVLIAVQGRKAMVKI